MSSYAQKLAKTLSAEDAAVVYVCLKQIAHRPPDTTLLLPQLEALLEDDRLVSQTAGTVVPLRMEAAWALAAQRGKLGNLTPVIVKQVFEPMTRRDIEALTQKLGLKDVVGSDERLKLLHMLWHTRQLAVFDLELHPTGFPNGIYSAHKK